MAARTKSVKAGKWRTLETFWNITTSVFFRGPSGARIRIRYAASIDRQKQTLDGINIKRLKVGKWSFFVARVQIHVQKDTQVSYDVWPGDVAVTTPGINV